MKKILVVGAGNVGAHIIQTGILQGVAAEFLLLDINQELEHSQILDLRDTLLFAPNARVRGVDFGDLVIQESDIIVVTAGANQAPGENRCDLLSKNYKILQDIAQKMGPLKASAIVLLVTNPVDILTHLAYSIFDIPKNQIFGTGTLLDSARLRWRLAEVLEINVKNVHGYVLGEHGDSEFVAWSMVSPAPGFSEKEKKSIETLVQKQAYEIIQGKGATYFGIAAATVKLLKAILGDTREVLPVSTRYPHTKHSALLLSPVGIPAIIGREGIVRVPELGLEPQEMEKLESSAQKLLDLYGTCEIKNH